MSISKPAYLCDDNAAPKDQGKKRFLPKCIDTTNNNEKISKIKIELDYINIPTSTKIIVVTTPVECDDCCNRILSLVSNKDDFLVLSLDIEWKVEFLRGVTPRPVALLQLASKNLILLFHLKYCTITSLLMNVLASDKIFFIGVGISGDIIKLLRDVPNKDYVISNYFDLRSFHYTVNSIISPPDTYVEYTNHSLLQLLEIYTNITLRKEKTVRISDWEVFPLTTEQISYAAEDAYAGIIIYHKMMEKITQKNKITTKELQQKYIKELLTQEVANTHQARRSEVNE